jgi:hypothetical protein
MHIFLTSALDGDGWSASRRITPRIKPMFPLEWRVDGPRSQSGPSGRCGGKNKSAIVLQYFVVRTYGWSVNLVQNSVYSYSYR